MCSDSARPLLAESPLIHSTFTMDKSLTFFQQALRTSIRDLSALIRQETLAGPVKSPDALGSIVYFTLLEDELNRLLTAESALIATVQRALEGEPFEPVDLIITDNTATSAYEYCYSFFTRSDCPLGMASPELSNWIASYVDQQQSIRDSFTRYFPDVRLLIGDIDRNGDIEARPITDMEIFDSRTRGLLDDIERNRALVEFNERMLRVKSLLEQQASAVQILTVLLNDPIDD